MILCSVVVIRELGLQAGCAGALVHGLRYANDFLLRELPLEAACADGVGTVPLQARGQCLPCWGVPLMPLCGHELLHGELPCSHVGEALHVLVARCHESMSKELMPQSVCVQVE